MVSCPKCLASCVSIAVVSRAVSDHSEDKFTCIVCGHLFKRRESEAAEAAANRLKQPVKFSK